MALTTFGVWVSVRGVTETRPEMTVTGGWTFFTVKRVAGGMRIADFGTARK
jgi:phage gp37-like protein